MQVLPDNVFGKGSAFAYLVTLATGLVAIGYMRGPPQERTMRRSGASRIVRRVVIAVVLAWSLGPILLRILHTNSLCRRCSVSGLTMNEDQSDLRIVRLAAANSNRSHRVRHGSLHL